MTVLVTGGTGFIGGAVVRALVTTGQQVRVLARPTRQTEQLVALGVEIARGDILDAASVEAALQGCDTLYHVAAIYDYWVSDKALLLRTEVEGTRNTMEAAKKAGLRKIVYTSSAVTIGEREGEIATETTLHRGYHVTDYERAKYEAERVVLSYVAQGLPVVLVNPAAVYGPGDLKPTGRGIIDVLNGKIPALFPGALAIIYIDDVATGHLLAAERGRVGQRYILCERNLTLTDWFDRICGLAGVKRPPVGPVWAARALAFAGELGSKIIGKAPLLSKDTLAISVHGLRADGSKAAKELGLVYTPLEEGLPKTLAWYWEHGHLKHKPAFLEENQSSPDQEQFQEA